MRAGKSRSLQKSDLLRHLHSFYFTLQKRKENSCHTQKRVNQCSVTDTRRQMGPMYKRFQHIYTCTHRIMHRRHTICHICTTATQRQHDTEHSHTHTHTRYTSTEDRRGKRLFWKDEMDLRQPGEQHEQHVHQNQSARTQSLILVSELRYECTSQSTRFCVLFVFLFFF